MLASYHMLALLASSSPIQRRLLRSSLALLDDVHDLPALLALLLNLPPESRDLNESAEFLVVLYEYSQLDVFFVLGVVFAPAAGRLHDLGASLAAFTDVVLAVRLLGAVRLHQQGGADRAGQGVPQYGQRPVEVLGSRCEGHPVTLSYFTCQVWAVSGSPWRTTRAVET